MKILSSNDEILLLAILKLQENAYGVTIRREVSKATGKNWSIGAIYDPLYRLEQKGLVDSLLSEPTGERGGRSKRLFTVTPKGMKQLAAHKKVRDNLWQSIIEFDYEKNEG
ncbi:PadR family transcriptional regulator [Acidobacteriota bacterium]